MDISTVLFVIVASLYVGVNGYDCPDTWVEDQGSCYLFVNKNPMTIYQAEHYCNLHHGAHLVQAETSAENEFLKSYMRGWGSGRKWLGLTDEGIEGIWKWYTTGNMATYKDWSPTEPDSQGEEDCVFFDEGHGYEWCDITCNTNIDPICEKSVTSEVLGVIG